MINEVMTLFNGNIEAAAKWMGTRMPALAGKTPAECVESGDVDKVATLAGKLEHGVVV